MAASRLRLRPLGVELSRSRTSPSGPEADLADYIQFGETLQCETRTGDEVGHLAGKRDHPAGHTVPRRACTERNLQ